MKRKTSLILAILVSTVWTTTARAQDEKSPVTTAAKEILQTRQKNLIASAEEMPDNKYGFKPTPQQMSFGAMMAHVAGSNYKICSKIGGGTVPQQLPTEKDPKTKLVTSLRESFEFCSSMLGKVDDSMLGQKIELFGSSSTKGKALLEITGDWADHYAAAAMYLRLNGLLPPTAKQK